MSLRCLLGIFVIVTNVYMVEFDSDPDCITVFISTIAFRFPILFMDCYIIIQFSSQLTYILAKKRENMIMRKRAFSTVEKFIISWSFFLTCFFAVVLLSYEVSFIFQDFLYILNKKAEMKQIRFFIDVLQDFVFPVLDFLLGLAFLYLFYK